MNRRALRTAALTLVFVIHSLVALASSDWIRGEVEAIDKKGLITVAGTTAQITEETVLMNHEHELLTVREILVGVLVEMEVEDGPDGTTAVSITATVPR